jgi:hypothetical protein
LVQCTGEKSGRIGSLKKGNLSDQEDIVPRETYRPCAPAGEDGDTRRAGHLEDLDLRSNFLPVEKAIWQNRRGRNPEIRRLKQLKEENQKLKQLVADLSLDKLMLQHVLSRKI